MKRYLRSLAVVLLLVVAWAVAGCGTESSSTAGSSSVASSSDVGGASGDSVTVPDVSGEDGADAVSDVEDAVLSSTLEDSNGDPGFDTGRDATGCEVTDQDPAAGTDASEGNEVTITVDCSQVDWENQEGAQWEAFSEAYTSGFDDGCQALFDQSPDGSLYEDNVQYTADDCSNLNPGDGADGSDVPSDVPDDPEAAGDELGQLDGCQALFEQDSVTSLNYGTDSYTEDDCPLDSSAPAAGPPPQTEVVRVSRRIAHVGVTETGRRHLPRQTRQR